MNDDELRSAFTDLVADVPDDRVLPAATAGRVARRRGLKLGVLGGAGALAAAAVVVLVVTVSGDDRLIAPVDRPTPTPGQAPTTAPTTAPTATTPSGTPSTTPSGPVRIVLRPDGLGFTDGGSSTSALAFGTEAATARTAVARVLGQGGETPTPDCGEGASTVQHEGLFLQLQDGRFVGWTTGTPGTTTGDGIGVGSTLAELRAALPEVEVTEGTLGPEWSTVEGGLAGFLDGTQDSSVVNSMAAGVRCLAR